MDFQRGVVERLPGLDALVSRVQRAIADVRGHGGIIVYVRVAFTEADWAAIPPANAIFARFAENRMMHHEDPSTAIDDRLAHSLHVDVGAAMANILLAAEALRLSTPRQDRHPAEADDGQDVAAGYGSAPG